MVLEVVDIRVADGRQAEFEEAVRRGVAEGISKSPGYVSYELRHSIETPTRYLMLIQWEKLEDHTVTFRESDLYGVWRGFVGPYFDGAPSVEHFERAAAS